MSHTSYIQQSLKEGLTVQERMKLFEAKDSKKIWPWRFWLFLLPGFAPWPDHCSYACLRLWSYKSIEAPVKPVPAAFRLQIILNEMFYLIQPV